jgi:predicted ABC-type ATPase
MSEGRSFVMETVFSHPSKLDLLRDARDAGYRLTVFHLNLASANLAVARVNARVTEGGHEVPEQKIRDRFARNQQLIRQAVLLADRALVFDSSALNERPTVVLEMANGQPVNCSDERPDWFEALYGDLY